MLVHGTYTFYGLAWDMDSFALLPKTTAGALLDLLLLAFGAAAGRKAQTTIGALSIAWMAAIVTHILALLLTGPEMRTTYHLIPRLFIGVAAAYTVRLLTRRAGRPER